jgi:hypothetical protein
MRERLAGWFELDEVGLESLRESLNAAKDDPPSLEDAAAPFRGAEPDVCEGVFAFLVEVATIDGVFEESERAFLVAFGRKVATLPKGFQQYATDKMKAINAAYAALRAALADQGFRVRT